MSKMESNMQIVLSEPIGWALIISIIIIAATILIWLIISIIMGYILLKKIAQLTTQINKFSCSLQKNTEKISDQISESVSLFNQSAKEQQNSKFNNVVKGIMGAGVVMGEMMHLFKKFKGGK